VGSNLLQPKIVGRRIPVLEPGIDDGSRVAALGAMYEAERQDAAGMINVRLAVIALQLTYLGFAVVVVAEAGPEIGPWSAGFIASPLWFMHAYHLILVAMSILRVRSVQVIEDQLYAHSGMHHELRDLIGVRAGAKAADFDKQSLGLKLQAAVSYGGIGIFMIAFSVYGIIVAARSAGWASAPVVSATAVLVTLLAVAAYSWLTVIRMMREPVLDVIEGEI
jgi:hypothetical protein